MNYCYRMKNDCSHRKGDRCMIGAKCAHKYDRPKGVDRDGVVIDTHNMFGKHSLSGFWSARKYR